MNPNPALLLNHLTVPVSLSPEPIVCTPTETPELDIVSGFSDCKFPEVTDA